MNDFNLIDSTYTSIVVESKQDGVKQKELITLLDTELNLYSFIVNKEKKSFEPFGEVIHLSHKLKLDAEWLIFNKKPQFDFDQYK